jgi:hypothetical protein
MEDTTHVCDNPKDCNDGSCNLLHEPNRQLTICSFKKISKCSVVACKLAHIDPIKSKCIYGDRCTIPVCINYHSPVRDNNMCKFESKCNILKNYNNYIKSGKIGKKTYKKCPLKHGKPSHSTESESESESKNEVTYGNCTNGIQCNFFNCTLSHPEGRTDKCSSPSNCPNKLGCKLLHTSRHHKEIIAHKKSNGNCTIGIQCNFFNCTLSHPEGRTDKCSSPSNCPNKLGCKLLHTSRHHKEIIAHKKSNGVCTKYPNCIHTSSCKFKHIDDDTELVKNVASNILDSNLLSNLQLDDEVDEVAEVAKDDADESEDDEVAEVAKDDADESEDDEDDEDALTE